jgi:hypothetical protein
MMRTRGLPPEEIPPEISNTGFRGWLMNLEKESGTTKILFMGNFH